MLISRDFRIVSLPDITPIPGGFFRLIPGIFPGNLGVISSIFLDKIPDKFPG